MKRCSNCGHIELSKTERFVRDYVRACGGIGVREVAERMRWSRSVAATILLNLWKAGILTRQRRLQEIKYRPTRYVYK